MAGNCRPRPINLSSFWLHVTLRLYSLKDKMTDSRHGSEKHRLIKNSGDKQHTIPSKTAPENTPAGASTDDEALLQAANKRHPGRRADAP